MEDADRQELLRRAQQKAAALLEGLKKDEADLKRHASGLTPEQAAVGLAAHAAAIDAAAATLDNLRQVPGGVTDCR